MRFFKAAIGLVATVGAVASAMHVADAASAASTGFVPATPEDAPFIDHVIGRYVTNKDPANARNAVVSLGLVEPGSGPSDAAAAGTPGGPATMTVTVNIRAAHEDADTGPLSCFVIFNHAETGAEASAFVSWDRGEVGSKSVAVTLPASRLYLGSVYCAIPRNATGAGTQIYGVWTS